MFLAIWAKEGMKMDIRLDWVPRAGYLFFLLLENSLQLLDFLSRPVF